MVLIYKPRLSGDELKVIRVIQGGVDIPRLHHHQMPHTETATLASNDKLSFYVLRYNVVKVIALICMRIITFGNDQSL